MEILRVDARTVRAVIDSAIYSIDVIHKCFYWYGEEFDIDIETKDSFWNVTFVRKDKDISDEYLGHLASKIKRDIIDFRVRDIVTKDTYNIRTLLIAKAFSNSEWEENSLGDVSDPVGFNP